MESDVCFQFSSNAITTTDGYSGKLDIPLSAKMVRTWGKKTKTEIDENGVATSQLMWTRRSRLVGRDCNFLEYREDVYSRASSSSVVKLLPCMALSDGFVKDGVIATLDVSDAFLQVPQPIPRKISLDGCEYIILKCLPGQRDASRLWYSYFVERLSTRVSVEVCPEQPCILTCGSDGVLLLHVDDVLIHGSEQWISGTLIPGLEKEFKSTHTTGSVHLMNGIIIHSTSRSQKCISLSSTEAEWYAALSGVCDAYYLHIVEFVTDGNCNILTLHTDNRAVRMLSLKFGVGRLRRIRGRMLWLQERMASHELDIQQVPTLQNIADLNTKGHSKNRFLALLYMFGFVTSKGDHAGENEFAKQQAKETMKKHVKLVGLETWQ